MKREIVYNKLVRDRILDIIIESKKEYKSHIANNEEYIIELIKKVREELKEFEVTPNEEEMADIYEVLESIVKVYNLDENKIKAIKEEKVKKRGGFEKRIILEKVYE